MVSRSTFGRHERTLREDFAQILHTLRVYEVTKKELAGF